MNRETEPFRSDLRAMALFPELLRNLAGGLAITAFAIGTEVRPDVFFPLAGKEMLAALSLEATRRLVLLECNCLEARENNSASH